MIDRDIIIRARDAEIERLTDLISDARGAARRVLVLEDDNKSLRKFIAASQECATASRMLESEAERDRVTALVSDALNKITAGQMIRFGACSYCEAKWLHDQEGASVEDVRALAAAHANKCPKNPIKIERDELRAALLDVCDTKIDGYRAHVAVRAARSVANDTSEPFSVARANALAEEWTTRMTSKTGGE